METIAPTHRYRARVTASEWYTQGAAVLVAGTVMFEMSQLSGLLAVPSATYQGIHLASDAVLIGALLTMYRSARRSGPNRRPLLLVAVGLASATLGDYVNSSISFVEPVTAKLTFALFLFGAGYALYVRVLWTSLRRSRHPDPSLMQRWPVHAGTAVVVNLAAWTLIVRPATSGSTVLTYGSLVFCTTLYVALPSLAITIFARERRTTTLVIALGAWLLPFSDLVLFGTWLDGDPRIPSIELYATNWVLYFSGQVLFSLLPVWLVWECSRADEQVAGTPPD